MSVNFCLYKLIRVCFLCYNMFFNDNKNSSLSIFKDPSLKLVM
ncbi:hypothetical protein GCM10010129_84390 [Streptomyces fumigatiscleroticus]|nr:hypothetical protein GCM10010129_84390 [Streptomyces fumigatiscleroticus]